MIKTFRSKALSELWSKGRTTKIDKRLAGRMLLRLEALENAVRPSDMNVLGFRLSCADKAFGQRGIRSM